MTPTDGTSRRILRRARPYRWAHFREEPASRSIASLRSDPPLLRIVPRPARALARARLAAWRKGRLVEVDRAGGDGSPYDRWQVGGSSCRRRSLTIQM